MEELGREADHLAQPVHDQGLQLGGGGRGGPGEAEAVDAVGQHVAEQGGVGVEGREVGVHVRALPVGHARHDHPLDVLEDLLEVLPFLRSSLGHQLSQVARLHLKAPVAQVTLAGYLGEDPAVPDVLQVVRDVVHHLLPWGRPSAPVSRLVPVIPRGT